MRAVVVLAAFSLVGAAVVGCADSRPPSTADERTVRVEAVVAVTPRGPADTVEYTVRFDDRQHHYVDVEGVFPAGGDSLELMMPTWTPGSYLVREYARHVEALAAHTLDGTALAVAKTRKNRWTVQTAGAARVVVRYRLYARAMSVRTNFVDGELAVLVGASTFLAPVGSGAQAYDVRLEVPEDWRHSVTSLAPHPGGDAHRYLAPSYDALVDAPILAGNPALYTFEIEGVPHRFANFDQQTARGQGTARGESEAWDGPRSAADVEAIVREQTKLWGVIPYDRYVFLSVLTDEGGRSGLEHQFSTLLRANRWMTRTRESYIGWLGLVSHEFFHTWNVKRLRPVELGPFDYETEVHTRSLWVAEGVTSYYDDLVLRRAGLIDTDEYLAALSTQIQESQDMPGRRVQSLAEASYDAWIKYYRADENTVNVATDYYRKGAVVGWLLDAEIRRRTRGARSLDDVMRLAFARYAGDAGYTPEQFRAVCSEVAGASLDAFFAAAVDGTDELDYEPALAYFGLRFRAPKPTEPDADVPGWLGAKLTGANVSQVRRGTPAYAAGVSVGDEILAIGEYRVDPAKLDERLKQYRPGDEVSLLVARRGVLTRVAVTLGEVPKATWTLERVGQPAFAQTARLNEWLGGR